MKGALIALLAGVALVFYIYFKLAINKSKTAIDFHLHDTYLVLDYTTAIILALILLGTFFSIGGLISTRFSSKLFWVLAVLFLSAGSYYAVSFYHAFSST